MSAHEKSELRKKGIAFDDYRETEGKVGPERPEVT